VISSQAQLLLELFDEPGNLWSCHHPPSLSAGVVSQAYCTSGSFDGCIVLLVGLIDVPLDPAADFRPQTSWLGPPKLTNDRCLCPRLFQGVTSAVPPCLADAQD